MLTTKNAGGDEGVKVANIIFRRRGIRSFFLTALACVLLAASVTGCRPPGPQALLDGKELIDHGQYAEAIEKLKTATSLLNSNAQAWNYLGLAYHQAGQLNDAADAYKKALALDQNLVEVHYNLGCLLLQQNHPDLAKGELTAYTMHRGDKSPDAWVKLGAAQIALRDYAGAEKSLNQARLLDGQNPEALNDMGVVQMQRNRATEAAQFFNAALRVKPDFGPAILNLAIVSQHLNNRQYALQRYQDYLALKPRPANADEVEAAARALTQELSSGPAPVQPPAISRSSAPTNTVAQTPPRSGNNSSRTAPPKLEQPTSNSRSTSSTAIQPVETVQVTPEPVIRGAVDNSGEPVVSSNRVAESPKADHRGFFSRVNPANLFRSNKTDQPVVIDSRPRTNVPPVTVVTPEPPKPIVYQRYTYRSAKKPADGDRTAAQKAFVEGSTAQQAHQLTDAAAAYRRATLADPGYFDAYYNLGVVSFQAGVLPQALSAYETALAIQPDSFSARFNFALALKQANYPVDAANELEKTLTKTPSKPSDVTYAHYALGTLYAQQLRQPAKAREHYEKVLQLDPSFSQAAAIHDWLWANPR